MRILTLSTFALVITASQSCLFGCEKRPTFAEPPAGSYERVQVKVHGSGADESVAAARVTSPFFEGAGVRPLLGRMFISDEYRQGGAPVAVISNEYWQNRFGRDPGLIGRTIELDGRKTIVIGVMPRGFEFPEKTTIWLPAVKR